ncbi:MAG: hypothetical protein KAI24_00790 [Planctomycetes bacterium]|nr:hypothetical protein [Planctomycetota bacterium]
MRKLLPFVAALSAALTAQSPLTTTFAGGNGQSGNMFDVVALNPAGITISYFDVNLDPGTWDMEIYKLTIPGPYAPSVNTAADWTLVGSATGVVSAGGNVPTQCPIAVCEYIQQGATQAFYVTVTNGTAINYTNGTATGTLYTSNSDLEFYEGAGLAYPFVANFNPRVWNGNIHYSVGPNPNCGSLAFAARDTYGDTGCYASPRMVSEFWQPASTIDLINTSWTIVYQPGPAGGNYNISAGGLPYDGATPAATGIDLASGVYTSSSSASWDDASVTQTLPFAFPYPGAGSPSTTEITINSNGRLYLGNTIDNTFQANGANSLLTPGIFAGDLGPGLPVWAAFMCDLDPTAGGNIWYENPSPSGGVRITWDNIPNWQDPAGAPAVANYAQIELLPGGTIFLSYGSSLGNGGSAANEAIVGYSAGGGEGELRLDWSAITSYNTGNGFEGLACDADANPVLGTTININVDNIPAGTLLGGVIYGLTKFDPGISLLGPLGVPCDLYTSLDVLDTGALPGSTYSSPFNIPNNTALAGFQVFCQGFCLNATIPNPLGALTSNGVELTVGS